MKILYFDNLEYDSEYADLVKCPYCHNDNKADAMVVPIGNEFCPICGDETIWANDNNECYEVKLSEIFNTEEIIHINANYREVSNDMADEANLSKIAPVSLMII